jgi:pyruvate-formate lyase-activating enzyme
MNPNLKHLYISPLEACNLRCQICYTTKTTGRLSNQQIIGFIDRYSQQVSLETVTFCGGEVFLLTDFPGLVNTCVNRGIFVQIITNGTVDRLHLISSPNSVNLIVSLDGLPDYHDQNRGAGNWDRSLSFLKHAQSLGFHLEVFSIVTQENLSHINAFEKMLFTQLGQPIPITYHPRKPLTYLNTHPVSNQCGQIEDFSFLTPNQHLKLSKQKSIFPPRKLNCYQISIMSDGQIYGCCEGIRPIGNINSDISNLISEFENRIDHSIACIEPDFVCGLRELYVT